MQCLSRLCWRGSFFIFFVKYLFVAGAFLRWNDEKHTNNYKNNNVYEQTMLTASRYRNVLEKSCVKRLQNNNKNIQTHTHKHKMNTPPSTCMNKCSTYVCSIQKISHISVSFSIQMKHQRYSVCFGNQKIQK